MRDDAPTGDDAEGVERRLGLRLAQLRVDHGLSLDDLAERTGISRATLSRIERAETSPTAAMLGRLCAAFGRTMSRLLAEAEGEAPALVRFADQPAWTDPETGFRRRAISPPGPGLRLEMVAGELPAGAEVRYPAAPVPGIEQHLLLLDGALDYTLGGRRWRLAPGDVLRIRIDAPTALSAPGPAPARYVIAIAPA